MLQALLQRISKLLPEGTDIDGTSIPSGGSGARGWLSAIWSVISTRLPATLSNGRLSVDATNDISHPIYVIESTSVITLVLNKTTITTGLPIALASSYANFGMQLIINSGNLTNFNANLQGSLNGTKWFTLCTINAISDGSYAYTSGKPCAFVRAQVTLIAGTANVTLLLSAT